MLPKHKERALHRKEIPQIKVRLVKLLCALMIIVPYAMVWFAYYRSRVCGSPSIIRSIGMMAMYSALYYTFARIYEAFLISHKRISEIFFSQVLAVFMTNAFILCIMFVICGRIPNVLPLMMTMAVQVLLSLVWSKHAHQWFFRRHERAFQDDD